MGRKSTPGLTKVTFMTTGIFLMRLVNNPKSLRNYTHIIMDEVHERDLDIDFSLVVVKHLLGRQDAEDGLKFKLIFKFILAAIIIGNKVNLCIIGFTFCLLLFSRVLACGYE